MNSYLQTLRSLQQDNFITPTLEKNIHYNSYEDYLHQSKLINRSKIYNGHPDSNKIYLPDQDISKVRVHQLPDTMQGKKEIQYIPVERTIVELQDQQIRESVPVKRKVIQYREQKQMEIVPREVTKTDYYAVQHIRSYVKEIVPEKVIQHVKVPKVIRNVEYIPVEKQIIYYPDKAVQNGVVCKEKVNEILEGKGITISPNAEYKVLLNHNLQNQNETHVVTGRPTYGRIIQGQDYVPQENPLHLKSILKKPRFVEEDEVDRSFKYLKKSAYSPEPIPFYNEANYNTSPERLWLSKPRQESFKYNKQSRSTKVNDSPQYSFAEKDRYRYNRAVNYLDRFRNY